MKCQVCWTYDGHHEDCELNNLQVENKRLKEHRAGDDFFGRRLRLMDVYQARQKGREYCQTEGSSHYQEGGIEPLDLLISKGMAEDFCLGNIIKYAARFKHTRNYNDLKKVADYAHILCGLGLE